MGNLFVSFDDGNDPTYASADSAWLVDSTDDGSEKNPCVGDSVVQVAPVVPETLDEAKAFAAILGWSVEYDNESQMILYTGIIDKSRNAWVEE